MPTQRIAIDNLLLDLMNPRHAVLETQRQAIDAIIEDQGPKLVTLARHIAEQGMNPIDRVLVIADPNGKTYTVVEGNRRVTAIKILRKPDLAAGTALEKDFKELAPGEMTPASLECEVFASREDARPWQELRHTGEAGGAGTIPWGARQRERFAHVPGSQAAKGNAFVDAVAAAYPNDSKIRELVTAVADERITTLGRVVGDPNFRTLVGMAGDEAGPLFAFTAAALRATIRQLLSDFAEGGYTVSDVKSKSQREDYLKRLPKPDATKRLSAPAPLEPSKSTGGGSKPKPKPKRKPKKAPPPLLDELDLTNCEPRLQDILDEVRLLDLTKFPNASAVLLRVIIELAVGDYYDFRGWAHQGEFKNRVKKALYGIDASDKAPEFQAVRAGLSDGTSIFAVSTLHGYVHNKDFHPTANDVRRYGKNFEPFLQALNDAIT